MNKRYYALDALKFAISPFYDPKNYKTFSERLIEFCNKFEDEDILKLFNGKYGIGKDNEDKFHQDSTKRHLDKRTTSHARGAISTSTRKKVRKPSFMTNHPDMAIAGSMVKEMSGM